MDRILTDDYNDHDLLVALNVQVKMIAEQLRGVPTTITEHGLRLDIVEKEVNEIKEHGSRPTVDLESKYDSLAGMQKIIMWVNATLVRQWLAQSYITF